MIDLSDKTEHSRLKTKAGVPFKISFKSEDKDYPFAGEVKLSQDKWVLCKWNKEGISSLGSMYNLELEKYNQKVLLVLVRPIVPVSSPEVRMYTVESNEITKEEALRYVKENDKVVSRSFIIIGSKLVTISED